MPKLLVLGFAGAVGTVARYWLSGIVHRYSKDAFPAGTLAVNLVGCLFIGLLMSLVRDYPRFAPDLRAVLTVGLIGGFTTFSAFGYETVELARDGSPEMAALNVAANVLGGIAAVWLGALAGRALGA